MNTASRFFSATIGFSICVIGCNAEQARLDANFFGGDKAAGDTNIPIRAPVDGKDTPASGVAGMELTAGIWDDNLNFDIFESYLVETANIAGIPSISIAEQTAAKERFITRPERKKADIVLVLDTTGSMSDELNYLKQEFSNIEQAILSLSCRVPIELRWGLVAYSDENEAYLVMNKGFPENFEQELESLPGTHGGDYPEAAAEGLDAATKLEWRNRDDVARLIFWVADAPHHIEKTPLIETAIRKAMDGDIHIYPVAASGLDERTEKTMRTAAQLTGGRYIFLTDDSGVGNSHKEPRIPCYFVTTLKTALQRAIVAEIKGKLSPPRSDEIIRTGGNPENGYCTLADGAQAVVF